MPWKHDDDRREYDRLRYEANVEYVKRYKLEKGCADCGYNAHFAALQFDHIQPRKRGTVASQMGKTLKILMEEINRCEVVCATCHAIRGYERGQFSRKPITALSSNG